MEFANVIYKIDPVTVAWIMAEVDALLDEVSESTGHGKAQRIFHERVMEMLTNLPEEIEMEE